MITQQDKAHIRKINNMLSRGKINSTTINTGTNTAVMTAQIDLMHGETQDGVQLPENWGFASRPPKDSEVIVGFFGGNRDHGSILKVFDKNTLPSTLNEGEAIMYCSVAGTRILLDKNGKINISTDNGTYYMTLDASGVLRMNCSQWYVNGYRLV